MIEELGDRVSTDDTIILNEKDIAKLLNGKKIKCKQIMQTIKFASLGAAE